MCLFIPATTYTGNCLSLQLCIPAYLHVFDSLLRDAGEQSAPITALLRRLALEWRRKSVRGEACKLVEGMWRHSSSQRRLQVGVRDV